MIRINLLARKVSKKKAGAIQHLAIGAGVLALLAAALAWVWFSQAGTLARLKTQIAAQEAEKVRLKNVNEEKASFEKEKSELERKLEIITKLQRQRIVPVHLLDELTRVIDVTRRSGSPTTPTPRGG
jgi:Tfp pilus assembly protein PilN